jgi:hypothetical protein
MHAVTLGILAILVGQAPQTQTAAIKAAKTSIVRDMDKTLPQVTFEAWLQGLVGAKAVMKWEVTDCGEQTGTPADRGRDFPMCAEVDVTLPGNRQLSLSLLVGSMARGLTVGPLMLFSGAVIGPDRNQIAWIKTLADVPKLVGTN